MEGGGTENRGRETDFKRGGGQAGLKGGCLKMGDGGAGGGDREGGLEPPYKLFKVALKSLRPTILLEVKEK